MIKNAEIKVTAIVPSAGKGARFKSKKRKPFAALKGKPLLYYALKTLQSSPLIRNIVLVVDKDFLGQAAGLVRRYGFKKVGRIVEGGRTRSDSVRRGLRQVDAAASFVLVHDGVRPFVSKAMIEKSVAAAVKFGAAVSAVPVKATIKVALKKGLVEYTPERKRLWEAQTPQVFRKGLLEKAYKQMGRNGLFTDDAALVEAIGAKVKIVDGDYRNMKITTAGDMKIAEAMMSESEVGS